MIFKEKQYVGMRGLIYEFLEKNKDTYYDLSQIRKLVFKNKLTEKTTYLYLYKLKKEYSEIKQIRRDKTYYYFEKEVN